MFKKRNLKWLAVLATIIMAWVQLGGALVTKTGSANGCGSSWPLCHGAFLPQNLPIDTIIELSHRATSALSLIVVLWLVITAWKNIGYIKEVKPLAIISVGFLLIQALVGAAAVLWQQNDYVLALHFGISLISFSSVFVLTLIIFDVDKKYEANKVHIDHKLRIYTWTMAICLYVGIYTGALVRHTDSSLAYGSWPLPFADLIPHTEQDWVQLAHRLLALVASISVFLAFNYAIRHYHENRTIRYGYTAALLLIVLQIVTGALSIFTGVNLLVALLHALIITFEFGLIAYFILLMLRTRRAEKASQ
ncbi:heme A synthase [Staphylococcus simulans]|uniref:COX15/CtaA family protein n=1 Tax=Staphylococcus simulans TaxID=1286 RepID=UPI001E3BD1F9|nr:heme A synthase [Staphylococcus simulans]MCD8914503.1 heme A synthase [Staphylococcus simulans]